MHRTNCSVSVFSLFVLLVSQAAGAQQTVGDDAMKAMLIGSYRLISFEAIDGNGNAVRRPYSVGRISYDGVGRMTAQLMPEGWTGNTSQNGSGAGFISYFGSYTFDLEQQAVIHHVEGALSGNMLGRSMVRYFDFSEDGNSLFLETRNNGRVTGRLRWDRITDAD